MVPSTPIPSFSSIIPIPGFNISISDPVAIIQQTPEKGNTSTTYSFGATASYSLTSRLKIYTWELFDSEGNKLDTLQGKTIKKQFKKP